MKLILVRHGLTEENIKKITQGQTHGKLSPQGIIQAKKVGLKLKYEKIDIVYSSDLKRAVDTTKEIIKFHPDTPVHYVKELREASKGIFDGRPRKLIQEYRQKLSGLLHLHKYKNGESLIEVQKRIFDFYKKLLLKHPTKTVLIISHGSAIICLLIKLLNKSFDNFIELKPDNCAITIVQIDKNKKPRLEILNCVKHLG